MSLYNEYVINSKGLKVHMDFSKVDKKYKKLSLNPTPLNINLNKITQDVRKKISNEINTTDIDIMAADIADQAKLEYPDASKLSCRIIKNIIDNYTCKSIKKYAINAYKCKVLCNDGTERSIPVCNKEFYMFTKTYHKELNKIINYSRDERLSHASLSIAIGRYLLRKRNTEMYDDNKKLTKYINLLESPQQLFLRNAIGKHMPRDYTKVYKRKRFIKLFKDNVIDYTQHHTNDTHDQDTNDTHDQDTNDTHDQATNDQNGEYSQFPKSLIEYDPTDNRSDNLSIDKILQRIEQSYSVTSMNLVSIATPELLNIGTHIEQLLSCFVLGTNDDTDDIINTFKDACVISKRSGGIGVNMPIRANKSNISSSNGESAGLFPFIDLMNKGIKIFNQGGKRAGSAAIYLNPTQPDFLQILAEQKVIDQIYYAFWIPDELMKRAQNGEKWYFINPHTDIIYDPEGETTKLYSLYGKEWSDHYKMLIAKKKVYKFKRGILNGNDDNTLIDCVDAIDILKAIIRVQIETGKGYQLYADACNEKSNHKNIGTIRGSNLCAEILEYFDAQNTACCCVSTICVNSFVVPTTVNNVVVCPKFDHQDGYTPSEIKGIAVKLLVNAAMIVCRDLNRVIDINDYPTESTLKSNLKTRPLAIGIQGLADMFFKLDIAFTSNEAKYYNKLVMECIYYGALKQSMELAKIEGPYELFKGSPFSEGKLQFHMWQHVKSDECLPDNYYKTKDLVTYGMLEHGIDWDQLIDDIKTYGIRNSLLTSCPPTASSAILQGNTECFEPIPSVIYSRATGIGNYIVINENFIQDLKKYNIYNPELINSIGNNKGSVQNIKFEDYLPKTSDTQKIANHLRLKYKSVMEISRKDLIDMDADRALCIDQSQSSNRFTDAKSAGDSKKLLNMHFYSWNKGLKTGMYYYKQPEIEDSVEKMFENIGSSSSEQTCSLSNNGKSLEDCGCTN